MATRLERSQKFSLMLSKSRNDAGVSQKTMAQALGKSVNTIQNWESGIGCPNFLDLEDWFEFLGLSLDKYMMEYKYPKLNNYSNASRSEILSRVTKYLNDMTENGLRMLEFNMIGKTGSNFLHQNNLACMYNHLPLKYRIVIAITILENFNLVNSLNELICKDDIMPNIEAVGDVILAAKKAVYAGKNGYHTKKTD